MKPVIGEWAINVDIAFSELLKCSAAERSSIVRRVAAEMLNRDLQSLGKEAIQLANVFASDKPSAVAERGKLALKNKKKLALIKVCRFRLLYFNQSQVCLKVET
ncbi:hypothetical protein [Pseudoalteromonas luteoviolacea]|uniref:Uncharacterized protein n=1 Tax=Pseudoalteromonas luteoviolacea NCIMB 1942 TaxID=1365253 RepID=A0A161YBQ1_9GAMM|nr:hypothetical protein [Pseudoalteromonas luteoviolacea]KZN56486.1 hypothetical protein N482_24075 [Pseudoalteromonas luteoviolacea NCIMB 1942]KZW98371.1 hypothetical protein JL49_23740 [Pseudoalteromonas luteoviolacea]